MNLDSRNRHFDGEAELDQLRDHRESMWSKVDFAGEEKRKSMIEALKDFQKATGIDEKEYIKKLEACNSNGEINALEKKFKKASTKWYEIQLKRSGVFDAMDDRERKSMSSELDGLLSWFSGMPFTGDHSMVETLCDLEKNLDYKRRFRNRLKRQSKFVRNEYFRRLGSLPLVGSKEALLDNVLEEIKPVEDAPSAVQYEFKKQQKTASANKDTMKVRQGIMDKYTKRKDRYAKEILKNKDIFGGKLVKSPYGKIPLTALEFIEWFDERKSFAEMDTALKKLPSMVKQRKRLYEKRDKILDAALPKDKKKLTAKTNLMRRHELEAFLPELEKQVRKNSTHVAEYMSGLIGARAHNLALFQPLERTLNIRKFQLMDVEAQQAKLKLMEIEIADRERVVREYFALPSYLRKDQQFIASNAIDREKMLLDALEERNREKDSPFEISKDEPLGAEDSQNVIKGLRSHEGQNVMDKVMEELQQEGRLEAARVQTDVRNKIYGTSKRAETHDETQKESYLRDLKYWVRMDQNIKDESDTNNAREKGKLRYIEAASEAYDLGYAVTSGGEVHELQTISAEQIKSGSRRVEEQLGRAKYGEHVLIKDQEGRMERDPLEMIDDMSQQEVMKLMFYAINKLGRKHMGLGSSNMAMLQNSYNIQKEMSDQLIDREFKHLKAA